MHGAGKQRFGERVHVDFILDLHLHLMEKKAHWRRRERALLATLRSTDKMKMI